MLVQYGPEGIVFPNGSPARNVAITVVLRDTDDLAELFADFVGTPLGNPVSTDSLGNLTFIIENGDYDLLAHGARIQIHVPDIAGEALAQHIADPAPHVAYDNMASLALKWENVIT